ncbi:hypothetical protein [Clostridium sp. BNL1100]|uniref:hypothetical protein n=1 Tax=Clostridium sp. BNL1100 TaxID=755731 RepID=UPI00024A775A|nr:hypothetical protein [Clostridium sp. BNL1100]AEY67833.1 hypothetical protein Clo1100_3714 [Clostridium sp. BNL1100]
MFLELGHHYPMGNDKYLEEWKKIRAEFLDHPYNNSTLLGTEALRDSYENGYILIFSFLSKERLKELGNGFGWVSKYLYTIDFNTFFNAMIYEYNNFRSFKKIWYNEQLPISKIDIDKMFL